MKLDTTVKWQDVILFEYYNSRLSFILIIINQILKECDVRQDCNLFDAVNDTKYVHMSSFMIKVPLFVCPAKNFHCLEYTLQETKYNTFTY